MKPAIMGAFAWTPSLVSGLEFWLDGTYLPNLYQTNASTTPVVASGDAIGRIVPRAGSSVGAWDQATAGSRHTWSATGINGQGAINCVGGNSDDVLRRASGDYGDTHTAGWVCAVIKPTSVSGTQTIFGSSDEGATTINFCVNLASGVPSLRIADGTVSDTINGTSTLVADTAYVLEVGSDSANCKMFLNGVDEGTLGVTGTDGDWLADMSAGRDNLTLGARQHTSVVQEFSGYIGQLLYFEGYPSAADRLAVRRYVAGVYGITVGSAT